MPLIVISLFFEFEYKIRQRTPINVGLPAIHDDTSCCEFMFTDAIPIHIGTRKRIQCQTGKSILNCIPTWNKSICYM